MTTIFEIGTAKKSTQFLVKELVDGTKLVYVRNLRTNVNGVRQNTNMVCAYDSRCGY